MVTFVDVKVDFVEFGGGMQSRPHMMKAIGAQQR